MRKCPLCGCREEDDLLVACSQCGGGFDDPIKLTPPEIEQIERRVTRSVLSRLGKWVFGGFSIMALIGVIQFAAQFGALWSAGIHRLEAALHNRIAKEFEEPQIRSTVQEAQLQR